MSRTVRGAIAILVAGVVVVVAAWLDRTVIGEILARGRATFDSLGYLWAMSLGTLAVVAAVLGLGVLAWRSRSAIAGAVYVVAGGFLLFLPVIVWRFGAYVNDSPPLLPAPIAAALSDIWTWSTGPLNAVATIAGGMFLVGFLAIGRSLGGRADDAPPPSSSGDGQAIRP